MPFVVGFVAFLALNFIGHELIGPAKCNDGWTSSSIGKRGACSHHGGVNRLPGNLVLIFSIAGGIGAGVYANGLQSAPSRRNKTLQTQERTIDVSIVHEHERKPDEGIVSCPKCGSKMLERVAKKGRYAGNHFYGCTRYPKCNGIINKANE